MTVKKSDLFLKASSLLLGFGAWYLWGGAYPVTTKVHVPLCFYNVPTSSTIGAPEEVSITLRARRNVLAAIDAATLAVHINARMLQLGPNRIIVSESSLLLPDGAKLVHCEPANLVAFVHAAGGTGTASTEQLLEMHT